MAALLVAIAGWPACSTTAALAASQALINTRGAFAWWSSKRREAFSVCIMSSILKASIPRMEVLLGERRRRKNFARSAGARPVAFAHCVFNGAEKVFGACGRTNKNIRMFALADVVEIKYDDLGDRIFLFDDPGKLSAFFFGNGISQNGNIKNLLLGCLERVSIR